MGKLSKSLALLLTLIIAISCLTLAVKPADAQSITTPFVPEFTLKIVDSMVGGGLQTEIQNQPVIPNGHDYAGIFYDFRYRWHESANWYHPEPDPAKWQRQYIAEIGTTGVTTLVDSPNSYYKLLGNTSSYQLDVQIRAINGYQNTNYPGGIPIGIEPGDNPIIVVSASDWSNTQTINLTDGSVAASPSSNPTVSTSPTPTVTSTAAVPEFSWLVIVPLLLSVFSVALIVRQRKTANLNQ